jgi:hypothetical protein
VMSSAERFFGSQAIQTATNSNLNVLERTETFMPSITLILPSRNIYSHNSISSQCVPETFNNSHIMIMQTI